ncbi:MAG: hypothetical protein ONB46_16070 [candidate division KSB1 bacterium]|nr:hypothetical protein [candidate division KSB1 bacterium]MDZ7367320.1 hypothetical protein [candidate division KSB1 bacterium]MDZ7405841.1 hypothetical protein [candidate division KSB1 bacterium]
MLTREVMRYLRENPQVFNALPDKFELLILPEDDPAMRLYNLTLLDKFESEGKQIVFARIKSRQEKISSKFRPSLFIPVPIAA